MLNGSYTFALEKNPLEHLQLWKKIGSYLLKCAFMDPLGQKNVLWS